MNGIGLRGDFPKNEKKKCLDEDSGQVGQYGMFSLENVIVDRAPAMLTKAMLTRVLPKRTVINSRRGSSRKRVMALLLFLLSCLSLWI